MLHEAQIAGDAGFVGLVSTGAHGEPDRFLPLAASADIAAGIASLRQAHRAVWAVYLHRPAQPAQPLPEDFAEFPGLLRLTASLAIKGVLQLRAWNCKAGRVEECVLDIAD